MLLPLHFLLLLLTLPNALASESSLLAADATGSGLIGSGTSSSSSFKGAASNSGGSAKAALLSTYGDSMVRPSRIAASNNDASCATASPTVVDVQLHVDRFHMLDPFQQTFGFEGYLRLWWHDPRLVFNTTKFGCDEPLMLTHGEIHSVWRPSLYWEDVARRGVRVPTGRDGAGMLFEFSPDGLVFWSQQVSLELACPMDLARMPFDVQACPLVMGIYDATADKVALRWRPNVETIEATDVSLVAPEGWSRPTIESNQTVLSYASRQYAFTVATFSFRRLPVMYIATYVFPCIASVVMSSFGFFIQQDAAPARTGLGIVAMLIVLTNYLALTKGLPPGGGSLTRSVPWLCRLSLGSFFWTVAALVILVLSSFGFQVSQWLERKLNQLHQVDWQDALLRERDTLIALLYEWDHDKSGHISKREFRKGVEALGVYAPREEINEIFDILDRDGDGRIDFHELVEHFDYEDQLQERADMAMRRLNERTNERTTTRRNRRVPSGASHGASAPAAPTAVPAVLPAASPAASTPPGGKVAREPSSALDGIVIEGRQSIVGAGAAGVNTAARQVCSKVARTLEVESATAGRAMMRQTTRVRLQMRRDMREEIGKSWWWSVRTYKLLPCLAALRNLDLPARLLFPLLYSLYVLAMLVEVEAV